MPSSNAVLENHPLPTRGHARRYHYISQAVENGDPNIIAEEANRRAAQGYALFAAMPVQRGNRTDVVLVFARRLHRVKGAKPATLEVATVREGAPVTILDRPDVTKSED